MKNSWWCKNYSKPKLVKNKHAVGKKPKKLKFQKQSEDKTFKNIKNLFRLKE